MAKCPYVAHIMSQQRTDEVFFSKSQIRTNGGVSVRHPSCTKYCENCRCRGQTKSKKPDCSKCIQRYCFAGLNAHWTFPYVKTSTLHMFSYNSVIDGLASRASSGNLRILESERVLFQLFKFLKNHLIFQSTFNVTVSPRDQVVHIGHFPS